VLIVRFISLGPVKVHRNAEAVVVLFADLPVTLKVLDRGNPGQFLDRLEKSDLLDGTSGMFERINDGVTDHGLR